MIDLNAKEIFEMIETEKVWVFCDGYQDYTHPNHHRVFERIRLQNDMLAVTKKKDDQDTFKSNLNPRTEIRLENHQLENNVLYHIHLECNIDSISNANFFQILNRDTSAYPIFQLEKRGMDINSRERFNEDNRRIKRLEHRDGVYVFDVYIKTGENGILRVLADNKEIVDYKGIIRAQQKSWIQFGVYGDRNRESVALFKRVSVSEWKEDMDEVVVQLSLTIKNNKIVHVAY